MDGTRLLAEHPEWRWRILKRDEQLALCAGKMGKTEEAIHRMRVLFDEIEALDAEEAIFEVVNLDEAVELLTRVIHCPELSRRLIAIVQKLELDVRYEKEIGSINL